MLRFGNLLTSQEFLYELIYDENGVAEVMYFFALTHDVESDEPERRQWMN